MATLVYLCAGAAWAQSAPKSGPTVPVKHGIHTFDWNVQVVEPDGSLDDLPMVNRNSGSLAFDELACEWGMKAGELAGGPEEQLVMACRAETPMEVSTSVACDERSVLRNTAQWVFSGMTFTARCTEFETGHVPPGIHAFDWKVSVTDHYGNVWSSSQDPHSDLGTQVREQHSGTISTSIMQAWNCAWAIDSKGIGGGKNEERFRLTCDSFPEQHVSVSFWCARNMKPKDQTVWSFGALSGPRAQMQRYQMTTSCSDGSPDEKSATKRSP
jgi:hypothetical protein